MNYVEYLNELASRLPNPAAKYYAVTLSGHEHGIVVCSIYSEYVGSLESDPRIEVRSASTVLADRVVARWREAGERCFVVNEAKDLDVFLLSGGHSVVEVNVAISGIGEWLKPEPTVQDGSLGYTSVRDLPLNYNRRAPTSKLRMQVIKRDDFRCRICGRRSTDDTDIKLNVHHVRPWADGGVTIERNLITLCHTCHDGLSPHFERALHQMFVPKDAAQPGARYSEISDFGFHYNANLSTRRFSSKG